MSEVLFHIWEYTEVQYCR